MNKAHRDRIAFMRICSGEFKAGMEAWHVQGEKEVRLSQPTQMMAEKRTIIEEACGGDIIGIFDPGIYSIGDTITDSDRRFAYEGIPTFSPEHFARIRQADTMKRKQFMKGITQIAQEGAIQIFQEFNTGMEEIIVGVVGVLQFDVLKYRLNNEYNVEIALENLPYEYIRWIEGDYDINKISGTSDMKKIKDLKDRPLLLFVNPWSVGMVQDRNEGLVLSEFGSN
jgi:peptide chain release factor 3